MAKATRISRLSPQEDEVFLTRAWRLVDALIEAQQFISVIVAHTFVESVLISLIRKKLAQAKQIADDDFDRMGFAQILKWAMALEAVPADLKGALVKMNDYRNAFAHSIDHKALTAQQIQELNTALPQNIRDSVAIGLKHPDNVGKLSETLFALAAELVRCLDGKYDREAYFHPDRRTLGVLIDEKTPKKLKARK